MVSARTKQGDDAARLLRNDQKESSFDNRVHPKKGRFSLFSKKKNPNEYQPVTAPNTPQNEALNNITVLESEYDPSKPYGLEAQRTNISALTDRDGTFTSARRVDFDLRRDGKTETAESYVNSFVEPSTTFTSLDDTRTNMTGTTADNKNCSETLFSQTLGYFDDICAIPKQNDKQDPVVTPSPESRREWGTVPSEDESTFPSLQSTLDSAGTEQMTPNHNSSVEVPLRKKASRPDQQNDDKQDHENFEVVLDPTSLATDSKRRGWFAKEEREEDEKKSDESDAPVSTAAVTTAATAASVAATRRAKTESPSPTRKSLVKRLFSNRKKKDEGEIVVKAKATAPQPAEPAAKPALKPAAKPAEEAEQVERGLELTEEVEYEDQPSDEGDSATRDTLWSNVHASFDPEDKTTPSVERADIQTAKKDTHQAEEIKNQKDEKTGESIEVENPAEDVYAEELQSSIQTSRAVKKPKEKRIRSFSLGRLARSMVKPLKGSHNNKKSKDDSAVTYASRSAPLPAEKKKKKKKSLWKAVNDPNSGKTYYYHRKTRQTTWSKPKELKKWEEENSTQAKTAVVEEKPKPVAETDKPPGPHFETPDRSKNKEASEVVSPVNPQPVVERESSTESQKRINKAESGNLGTSPCDPDETPNRENSRDSWEKRKEIERLLHSLKPPKEGDVDKLMRDYEGREDILLHQLRDRVESRPFDEPLLLTTPPSPSRNFSNRSNTLLSKASATTRSSTITDKTERIRNTLQGRSLIETISENQSAATSISSKHDDPLPQPGTPSRRQYDVDQRIPSKVPVPRERELRVEELRDSRVTAETYGKGDNRVQRSGASIAEDEGSYYDGDNEVDTYGTDSVSALSETDTDFINRKDNFDQARRRALDDAIEREDWDLAAALSEGLKSSSTPGACAEAHNSWSQSELDKFIANNDWDAVKRYIARMRESKKAEISQQKDESHIQSAAVVQAPSRGTFVPDLTQDNALAGTTKRIGSKSQLQHKELLSESSWTSESDGEGSYTDSYDSEYTEE